MEWTERGEGFALPERARADKVELAAGHRQAFLTRSRHSLGAGFLFYRPFRPMRETIEPPVVAHALRSFARRPKLIGVQRWRTDGKRPVRDRYQSVGRLKFQRAVDDFETNHVEGTLKQLRDAGITLLSVTPTSVRLECPGLAVDFFPARNRGIPFTDSWHG